MVLREPSAAAVASVKEMKEDYADLFTSVARMHDVSEAQAREWVANKAQADYRQVQAQIALVNDRMW